MTSYLNSLSGHVANIRRLIPTSLSPDSDLTVSDPDDSHVSRVLRAYYTEKGRPFPPWLGPDPRAPQQTAPVYANTAASRNNLSGPNSTASRGSRGLGDLFGEGQSSLTSQQETLSLRQPRRPAVGRSPVSSSNQTVSGARPVPSQRTGSYQSQPSASSTLSSDASELDGRRGPSAQDRLKARFGGGGNRIRGAAPNQSNNSGASGSPSRQNISDSFSNYESSYGGHY